jgi:hypothetical protein
MGKIKIFISAIIPVSLFSLLIGTEDRRRLPAGRQGRPKRPNINLLPIIFLSFLPAGKVADNQKLKYKKSNFLCPSRPKTEHGEISRRPGTGRQAESSNHELSINYINITFLNRPKRSPIFRLSSPISCRRTSSVPCLPLPYSVSRLNQYPK